MKEMNTIKIIIADDHAVVRDGIKAVLERKFELIEVIGEAENGKELLEIAKKTPADIYIVDISMPILNGIETTERLLKLDPKNKKDKLKKTSVKIEYGKDSIIAIISKNGKRNKLNITIIATTKTNPVRVLSRRLFTFLVLFQNDLPRLFIILIVNKQFNISNWKL
jgi:CheY-like chemotaxis protein